MPFYFLLQFAEPMAQEIGNVQYPYSRAWTTEKEQKQAGFKADVESGAGVNGDTASGMAFGVKPGPLIPRTLCWVGFVLCSPTTLRTGTRLT